MRRDRRPNRLYTHLEAPVGCATTVRDRADPAHVRDVR